MKQLTILTLALLLSTTQVTRGDSATLNQLAQKHGQALLSYLYSGELTEKDKKELEKVKANSLSQIPGPQQKLEVMPGAKEEHFTQCEDTAYLTSGKAVLVYKTKLNNSEEYHYIILSKETVNNLLDNKEADNTDEVLEATQRQINSLLGK